ncbi:lactate/malate family dehydrogenase, partial [Parafannyhessea umbonata]
MTQLARKVVIIGAGNVGSHVAMNLMVGQYADEIVFLDINEAT